MTDRRKVFKSIGIAVACCALAVVLLHRRPAVHPAHIARRTSLSFDGRPKSDPLVEAAGNGDLSTVRKLLNAGVTPNAGSDGEEGTSALSAAASSGHLAAVTLLLERGADVNADDFWGGNALVGASLAGYVDVVRLLIAKGADPNMEDDGVTALDYASHQLVHHETKQPLGNYRTIVEILRANGAHSSGPTDLLSRILNPLG